MLNVLPVINKGGRTLTADQLAGVVGIKLPQIEEMLNSAESRFTAVSLNDAKATHYIHDVKDPVTSFNMVLRLKV